MVQNFFNEQVARLLIKCTFSIFNTKDSTKRQESEPCQHVGIYFEVNSAFEV